MSMRPRPQRIHRRRHSARALLLSLLLLLLAILAGLSAGAKPLSPASVLDACNASGFTNYSSFLKSFRALYGVTPTEYRAQLRQSLAPN